MVKAFSLRVAALALGLSALSFAVGVAGDLSSVDEARTGERVVVQLPPHIPPDSPRAGPLRTQSAVAAIRPQAQEPAPEPVVTDEKPRHAARSGSKPGRSYDPKTAEAVAPAIKAA